LIPLDEIHAARQLIAGTVVRTPLVPLNVDGPAEIYLKLENLQPIGSFKLRGAYNAMRRASTDELAGGVVTASAGNMAQGVAWAARELGVPATIIVPEHTPETKLAAIDRLGGRVVKVPFERWWQTIEEHRYEGVEGLFVHPVENDHVMAGNGTIGLEILEDLPGVDAVVIPWGGGGLTTGIASAVKQIRPETKIYAVEPETAAPLTATLAGGGNPVAVEYEPSFVDGAGSRALLPRMWEQAEPLLDGAQAVSLADAAAAVRLLAERTRVIAEGAGALAVAAALSGELGVGEVVVAVVSGGNIDFSTLTRILSGETA
jgi:threonine dehydratase